MDYDQLQDIRSLVRTFVRSEVLPLESEIDERDEVPQAIRDAAKEMGLFGMTLPTEYGGLGLNLEESVQLLFETGYVTPAFRSMFGTTIGIAGHVLINGGTEAQKKRWLPLFATGEAVAAFALTEADAGSDPSAMRTTADRDGSDWVLNGEKRFVTNAPIADVFMVFARTDPDVRPTRGISTFMVPRSTPGLSVGPRDHKMGQFGAWTSDVILDDVRVPDDALVGGKDGLNAGFGIAMECLVNGRLQIAAHCVGMANRLVDESINYARNRRQAGKPIASFQLVQAMIADSVTDAMTGRSLVLEASRAFDSGDDQKVGPSVAKYFCSEMICRVADRAVQIYGGMGYMRGTVVERFYRDARLFRIYEGTSQIQQLIIARNVIGRATAE
jgi:acyl-CoA dehydrogenase